jgi:ankyrin repeat protein
MLTTLFFVAALTPAQPEVAPPPRLKGIVVTPEVAAKLSAIAFQAARDGDRDTLTAYFKAGQPVNEPNARGDTLLTVAAYSGQPDAVKLILAQPKVDVDARNKMGLTALSAAAYKGYVGIAKQLVAAKADVNAASPSGQTALMFAALTGRAEVVEYLLSAGANARAADRSGNTPLSLARGQGADAVVRLLEAAPVSRKN